MKRSHRRWHRRVWALLPVLLGALLLAAWLHRPAPPAEAAVPPTLANVQPEDR